MANLTRKQVAKLRYVLQELERARVYIMSPQVAVCRKGNFATTTLHYGRADGQTLYEVTKEYGSDLTGLWQGIDTLKEIIK